MPRAGNPPRTVCGLAAFAALAALAAASAPHALAEIKGMPSLDASKPIGAPPAPDAQAPSGGTTPPTFTGAQVERGMSAYITNCADCHGPGLNDGEFGGAPLNGSYFNEKWGGTTVDALYGYIISAMPPDRPGRLTPQAYADITAFLLERNGFQEGSQELPADMDAQASMSITR